MGHPRGDEQPSVDVAVEIEGEGGTVGGRPLAEVVEDHPRPPPQDVPVVGLVEVVVETDDGSRLLFGPVGLGHLAPEREPAAPVGLEEPAPLISMGAGFDHDDVGNDV